MTVTVRAVLKTRRTHVVKLRRHRIALGAPSEAGRAIMAFQAHGEYNRPAQQPGVRRTVRVVANFAAFHAHRGMLENERPALLGVALDAGFLIAQHLLDHGGPAGYAPGRRESAVRIVAIATDHHAFIDAMLERHGELRTNIGMTAVAQLHLCFRQEKLWRGRRVDGVAIRAHHIVFGVGGAPDVGAGQGLGVTAQAVVQDLFRL